uniref:Uncharacterized protein n=1 Tax=Anopheles farauti TaxID=69004 RepID=A0A182QW56_9DIPT
MVSDATGTTATAHLTMVARTATTTTTAAGATVVLLTQPHQSVGDVAILLVEERGGRTEVTHATGTTDAMHVLLHLGRQIEVDHLLHVRNVQPTGGNGRRDQNRTAAASEQAQGFLTLGLRTIAVDARDRLLDRFREGGGEHERLTFARHRHAAFLDDAPNLRLEAHVQHTIGFVQHEEANVVQPDLATSNHVLQATGCGHNQMATALQITHLVLRVITTVQYGRAHARTVAELLRLLEDLRRQLAGWCQHQPERILLAAIHRPVRGWRSRTMLIHLVQNRHQEGCRLARASLRTGHQIAPGQNDRDSVLLNRGRFVVAGQLYVIFDDLCQLNVVEGIDVSRHIVTRRLHGNIFVLAEIDTGVAVFKQLRLQTLVALGKLCVVDLTTSASVSAAAASSAHVTPIVASTRPASTTVCWTTVVEGSAATAGTNADTGTAAFTGAGSSAAADATRAGRTHSGCRLLPTVVLWGHIHWPITATGRWSTNRTATSATVRRPLVSPAIASVTFRILIASTVAAALVVPIVVAPVATAAAIVAVITASSIVLVAATTTTTTTSPIEVSAAVVTIAVAPVITTTAISVRIAKTASSATSTTDTAAAYRTGTGFRWMKVATTISTFSQLRWNVPPRRMFRISGFWVAGSAAAKLLLLLLQVQTSKLHVEEKKTDII